MAAGDISAPTDTLIWNALAILEPRAVHVAGDVWAVAYEEYNDLGKVATVTIDALGNIGANIIDSLVFVGTNIEWPDIIRVSGNVFAIVYSGTDTDGFLCTVTINDNGTIDDLVIDTFEFETDNCRIPRIFHVAGTTFGITYSCNYTGKLVTVTIAANGQITEPAAGTRVFDAASCYYSQPIKRADNVFAIFYNRLNGPGRVIALEISDAGEITAEELGSLVVDAGVCLISNACKVSEAVFAYIYQKADYFYYVASVEIAAGGSIMSVKGTLCFEPNASYGSKFHPLRISDTIICVAYCGPGEDGFMKTIGISVGGVITDPVLDTLEFDTNHGSDPFLIAISEDIYAVFYQGVTNYGTIITPGIKAQAEVAAQHLLLMGIG